MNEFFTDLLTINFLLAFGIVILGGIMHGYTGWGGGMVMMPLMTLIFPPVESLALICVGGIVLTAQLYPSAMRTANWVAMRPLYIMLFIATPLGGLLLLYLDPSLVRKVIGVIIIAASILILTGWQYRGHRGIGAASVFGSIAGLANGFSGVGGPAMVVYILAHPDEPKVQRANIVLGAGLQIILITLTLTLTGGVTLNTLIMGAFLVPGQMIGGWLGVKIFTVAPQENFKKITLIAIVVLGASVVIL
jgi:uncharacterized protein